MRTVVFASRAQKDYEKWAKSDKKTFEKINELISYVDTPPFTGLGKPEPLKHELAGYWSRRINQKDRLVYQVSGDEITIVSCKGHYDDG